MEKLLDNGFEHDWKWIIGDRGELLWHDKPVVGFSISWLEFNINNGKFGGPLLGVVFFWMTIFSYVALTLEDRSSIYSIMICLTVFLLPFIAEVFHYYLESKTEYAITKDSVFFKFFNGWKNVIHVIPMSDIISINLVGNENDRGTLYLVTKEKVGFTTYGSQNGRKRDHPTLENVRNYKVAYEIIKQRIKNNPPREIEYKTPVISTLGLKIAQFIFSLVIVIVLFVGVQYYAMPFLKEGKSIDISVFPFLICLSSLVISLKRTFKDKEIKSDTFLPIIGINIWLVLIAVIFIAIMSQV